MNKNVKFIKQPHFPECRYCEGKGCKKCNNTGRFDNSSFHMIVTKPNGQKIGFAVDDGAK